MTFDIEFYSTNIHAISAILDSVQNSCGLLIRIFAVSLTTCVSHSPILRILRVSLIALTCVTVRTYRADPLLPNFVLQFKQLSH